MGYETDFRVTVNYSKVDDEKRELLSHQVEAALFQHDYQIILDELFSGKWYDWYDDMLEFSSQFPDVLFKVKGDGEENGDSWKAEFLGGKGRVVNAQLIFPEFGEFK